MLRNTLQCERYFTETLYLDFSGIGTQIVGVEGEPADHLITTTAPWPLHWPYLFISSKWVFKLCEANTWSREKEREGVFDKNANRYLGSQKVWRQRERNILAWAFFMQQRPVSIFPCLVVTLRGCRSDQGTKFLGLSLSLSLSLSLPLTSYVELAINFDPKNWICLHAKTTP